jgi:hypothetical protein
MGVRVSILAAPMCGSRNVFCSDRYPGFNVGSPSYVSRPAAATWPLLGQQSDPHRPPCHLWQRSQRLRRAASTQLLLRRGNDGFALFRASIRDHQGTSFLYTRCFTCDFPERGPSLFDPAQIARSQSCRQSLRQYPRHRNSIMLAPQSGQTRLRIAEIKLESVYVTTASEAIMSLPVVALLHRRCTEPLSAGPQPRFGEGARWIEAAASRFGFKRKSN